MSPPGAAMELGQRGAGVLAAMTRCRDLPATRNDTILALSTDNGAEVFTWPGRRGQYGHVAGGRLVWVLAWHERSAVKRLHPIIATHPNDDPWHGLSQVERR